MVTISRRKSEVLCSYQRMNSSIHMALVTELYQLVEHYGIVG